MTPLNEESPVRRATPAEIDALAELWFNGWQDAHAEILPPKLRELRTLESFRERLADALHDVRTAGPEGSPVGFALIKGDELYQLYVGAPTRGTGLAHRLTIDALDRIRERGHPRAWLACAIGNERAARFPLVWPSVAID
jgi:GNAT superfamily N-acetyltransferase